VKLLTFSFSQVTIPSTMSEKRSERIILKCSLLSLQPASAVRKTEEETVRFTEGLCKTDWLPCVPGRLPLNCPDNQGSRLVSIVIAREGDLPKSLGRQTAVVTDSRPILRTQSSS